VAGRVLSGSIGLVQAYHISPVYPDPALPSQLQKIGQEGISHPSASSQSAPLHHPTAIG